jgi:hypothetical protein
MLHTVVFIGSAAVKSCLHRLTEDGVFWPMEVIARKMFRFCYPLAPSSSYTSDGSDSGEAHLVGPLLLLGIDQSAEFAIILTSIKRGR